MTTLPQPLRALFEANRGYLAEHSLDPDFWKKADRPDDALGHVFRVDAFGTPPFAELQRDEADHLRRHGTGAARFGRAPWRIVEEYDALVAAFAAREPALVLAHAAILGHYVADLHVPLHCTVNNDGQLTSQRGMHARWESRLVTRFHRQLVPRVRPAPAQPARDALGLAFEVARESFAEAAGLLDSDRQSVGRVDRIDTDADERYDDAYYSRLFEREERRLVARLTRAAERLGALWLGAWEAAGRPELPAFRSRYVRGAHRAVLLSLDGAGERLISAAIARGAMPELALLRERGATAGGVVTTRPAKTASGHAALFTGAWSDRNGITGNALVPPGGSVVDSEDALSSRRLRAEPIWVTAARQGLDVTVVSAAQGFPFAPFLEERRFGGDFGARITLFDDYRASEARDTVLTGADVTLELPRGWPAGSPTEGARELALDIAATPFRGLLYDDPGDPRPGFDTLLLATRGDEDAGVRLKPRPPGDPSAFASLRLPGAESAVVHVRLFELSADGGGFLLYASTPRALRSNRAGAAEAALAETGGFAGNGAKQVYETGRLGPTLWQGGDGTAEERYLETLALSVRIRSRLNEVAIERTQWDLLVTYLPHPDEAFHAWLGHLESSRGAHDRALAERLMPYFDRALQVADGYVTRLLQLVGEATILAIGSDHGQIGARRAIQPNAILAAAGLLVLDDAGAIDVGRSRAVYHRSNSGFVLINRRSRGGPVAPDEEDAVRRAVAEALLAARDPSTAEPVVRAVLDARDESLEPGIGGPTGGDLYIVAAAGYDAAARTEGGVVAHRPPAGVHLFGVDRPEMLNSFTVSGPGVAAGAALGVIRQIDVAPTLTALMGIEPPRDAQGLVLEAALAWPDSR